MKKIVLFVITCLILVVGIAPANAVFAADLSDSIVLHLTATHTDSQVVINVNLITNTGVSAMTLELVYDENVFEFDDYAQGQGALTTFNLMHTGDFTPPIRFNWAKQNSDIGNDFSTGNLLTLYFTLKPDCQGGNYEIGLKNKGTEYLKNNNPTLKSAIIDKAVVNVAENKISEIEIKEAETEKDDTDVGLIVGAAVFAVAALSAAVTVLVVKTRKVNRRRKSWLKL